MLIQQVKKSKNEKQTQLDNLNKKMLNSVKGKTKAKYNPELFRKFQIKL